MKSKAPAHRMTKQRRVILDVLRSTDKHPTADWIYDKVRNVMPRISLGTVYRNLRVLKETGEILELNYGSTYSRFDGNPRLHYHFVCSNCGQVFDVPLPPLDSIDRQVTETLDAEVDFHRLEFYGKCRFCMKP